MASPADIALLRCELTRVSALAVREGADAVVLPTANALNATWVDAVANLGGYVLTFWELVALRGLRTNVNGNFNAAYDALQYFVDNPSTADLDKRILLFTALFGAAASRRGLADGCGRITFPGLYPADPRTLPQNLPDDLDQPGGGSPTKISPMMATTLGASAIAAIIFAWAMASRP